MATNFPGSLDSYSTKAASDTITEGHINDPQDAIEAIEAKVGTGASTPVANKVLISDGTGASTWDTVDVANMIDGATPVANGGTGQTTKTPAFDALSPLTTQGDIIYHDGSDNVRLAKGTNGHYLKQGATIPGWAAAIGSILDYGTSASSSTAKTIGNLHICYGTVSVSAGSSQAVTNLPFTSASSYTAFFTESGAEFALLYITRNSGSQLTVYVGGSVTASVCWLAIGT